jgi:NAD(P)-dependent dehydrogenase (short-subunit alcohol dehydrogenase family)
MSSNWTEQQIPDQHGRVAIVTGANTGLGFETARMLAEHGAAVVLAVRDVEKGRQAAARISGDVTVQALDLTSLDSIRAAASDLRAAHSRIDLLINNAGVMFTPRQTTADGFELQFGTNHLGHFALTGLLLDRLLPVPGSRVVTVSSNGHRIRAAIHFDDLQWERSYSRIAAYGQAKLANLMFTYELQHRLAPHGTTVAVAAHPGVSNTELGRNTPAALRVPLTWFAPLFSQKADMGALPTLRAATDPAVTGGQYYGPGGRGQNRGYPKLVTSSHDSHDQAVQQRLWAVSEDLTGVEFPVASMPTAAPGRQPEPAAALSGLSGLTGTKNTDGRAK